MRLRKTSTLQVQQCNSEKPVPHNSTIQKKQYPTIVQTQKTGKAKLKQNIQKPRKKGEKTYYFVRSGHSFLSEVTNESDTRTQIPSLAKLAVQWQNNRLNQ